MKVVPIGEFDINWHERAIVHSGKERFEVDGVLYPTDEEHAADLAKIRAVKASLSTLSPAQRRASRWATRAEVRKALEELAKETNGELRFGPNKGPWMQGSVTVSDADRNMITSGCWVNLSMRDGSLSYYCEAHADMLLAFARRLARVAGPQVTFLQEDYSPAEFTELVVHAEPTTKANAAPKPKAKAATKAKVKAKAKSTATSKTRAAGKTKTQPKRATRRSVKRTK